MAAGVEHPAPPQAGRLSARLGPLALMLLGVTLPVIVLDQLSKWYISAHLQLYQRIAVIPNWFDITYTLNAGAAFSLLANTPAWFRSNFLIGLSILAVVAMAWLIGRSSRISLNSTGMALIAGGAVGNLIDRLRLGHVVDFILVHYYSHNYPVFNAADSAITIGVAIILIDSLLEVSD